MTKDVKQISTTLSYLSNIITTYSCIKSIIVELAVHKAHADINYINSFVAKAMYRGKIFKLDDKLIEFLYMRIVRVRTLSWLLHVTI